MERKSIKELLADTRTFVIPVSTITLKNSRELIVKGQEMQMTANAYKDLLKIVNVSNKITNHLNATMKNGAGYSMVRSLLKSMKKNGTLKLYLDTQTKNIVRIVDSDIEGGNAISADAMEQFIDYILQTSGGRVELRDMMSADGGTKVTFNLKYTDEIALQIPGEDVSLGKQFTWDLLGPSDVQNLVERLLCSNGLIWGLTGDAGSRNILDAGSSTSDWYNALFDDINNPNKELINQYERAMLNARQSHLSLREYENVRGYLESKWSADLEMIQDVFGNHDDIIKVYDRRGIDIGNVSERAKGNLVTPVNAWDAINIMTDLASHTYKTSVMSSVRKNTQRKAGKLVNTPWDEDAIIYNAPKVSDFK